MKMTTWFAALAIALSCLRLFGMAVFSIERRTKEIGIRKVLGATVSNVTLLLSKDFVKLVLVANLASWPAAYFAMNKWLQEFAYRIEIGWWIFALAGGMTSLIALVTIACRRLKPHWRIRWKRCGTSERGMGQRAKGKGQRATSRRQRAEPEGKSHYASED